MRRAQAADASAGTGRGPGPIERDYFRSGVRGVPRGGGQADHFDIARRCGRANDPDPRADEVGRRSDYADGKDHRDLGCGFLWPQQIMIEFENGLDRRPPGFRSDRRLPGRPHSAIELASRAGCRGSPLLARLPGAEGGAFRAVLGNALQKRRVGFTLRLLPNWRRSNRRLGQT